MPETWELLYLDNNKNWEPVKALGEYGTGRYKYNEVKFEPVTTSSIMMIVKRQANCASGIQEWIIN